MRDQSKDYRLHGGDIPEPDLGYIEGTHHMGPASIVGPFEGSIFIWTQFTSNSGSPLLRLTLSTIPWAGWNGHNTITSYNKVTNKTRCLQILVVRNIYLGELLLCTPGRHNTLVGSHSILAHPNTHNSHLPKNIYQDDDSVMRNILTSITISRILPSASVFLILNEFYQKSVSGGPSRP